MLFFYPFRKDGDTMANNDKTAQAFDMIEQGVKDVYSSDKFKDYLSCLSKFHNYSLNEYSTHSEPLCPLQKSTRSII